MKIMKHNGGIYIMQRREPEAAGGSSEPEEKKLEDLPTKGLRISVLRNSELNCDCTLNVISAQHDKLTLVGHDIPELFNVTEEAPAVKVVRRQVWSVRLNDYVEYLHLEPVSERYYAGRWPIAGGSYGWTSDSRFPSDYPLSIHDRCEEKQ